MHDLERPAARAAREARTGGWRQWWPVVVAAAVFLTCGAILVLLQIEIQVIQQSLRSLPVTASQVPAQSHGGGAPPHGLRDVTKEARSVDEQVDELKRRADVLRSEVAALESLRTENAGLREKMERPVDGLMPEEMQAVTEARDQAARIACVNKLKQLALAVRLWANDHNDVTPPDVLAMTKEVSTPKMLVCPGDTGREPADDWASFGSANTSYTYLLPTASVGVDPARVLFMCPVHGSIALLDGSVHAGVAKERPAVLEQRDGTWIYKVGNGARTTEGGRP